MYKNMLEIKTETAPLNYTVNGTALNDEWVSFSTSATDISIRPNLQNLKETGKFGTVVFVDFESSTIGQNEDELKLLKEAEANLTDAVEYDLTSVIAFHTTSNEKRRFFIYTSLNQNDFMKRINDAFRLLPQMPLNFSGGEDANWNNYTACLEDLKNQ